MSALLLPRSTISQSKRNDGKEEYGMMSFVFVALGGALGAVGRYAISLIPVKTQFPILTLVTNILGAILIGFIVGITHKKADVTPNMVLFWKTGVCGGFTTFSTFSLVYLSYFLLK